MSKTTFTYDPHKATSNRRRHKVSFTEAASVFEGDPFAYTDFDADHSTLNEERFFTIGYSARGRLLYIVHTHQGGTIRLISARLAEPSERTLYEEDESVH